jgi:hypothetical protein
MTSGLHTQIDADRRLLIRQLRELIEALDRRVPDLEREGEIEIAADAVALRARAVDRLAGLERQARGKSPA